MDFLYTLEVELQTGLPWIMCHGAHTNNRSVTVAAAGPGPSCYDEAGLHAVPTLPLSCLQFGWHFGASVIFPVSTTLDVFTNGSSELKHPF